jgi:hypothetical protein
VDEVGLDQEHDPNVTELEAATFVPMNCEVNGSLKYAEYTGVFFLAATLCKKDSRTVRCNFCRAWLSRIS